MGTRVKKLRAKKVEGLLMQIASLERKHKSNMSEEAQHNLDLLRSQLKDVLNVTSARALQKLRFKYYSHGDKGSRLVSALLKAQRNKTFISAVKTKSGNRMTTTPAIAEEFCKFYTSLYNLEDASRDAPPHMQDHIDTFLQSIKIPTLNEAGKASLLIPFTIKEIEATLHTIPSGKSPGPDGFPIAYYKKFKEVLLPHFANLCNSLMSGSSLTPQAQLAHISILHKEGKDPEELLNTDLKWWAKLLSQRISKLLPGLIGEEQVIDAIFSLYSAPSAKVLVNGTLSDAFQIKNGTRQGCPLSPTLFVLNLETLLLKFRQSPVIEGLRIEGVHHKMVAFADDLLLMITNPEEAMPHVLGIFEQFGGVSNFKINMDKSEALSFSLDPPFSCSECGECFSHKLCLVKHLRIHTGEKHQKVHTGEKPYPCPECEKCFTDQSSYNKHQKVHTGDKPFICPECKKCFNRKDHLKTHLRTHTGEKPYSCPECGKCFSIKSSLEVHQRIHTGEKPFSCPECEKCFSSKSHLIKHQKTHTGEKPFSCPECGKCFNYKYNLVQHQRIHTGEKPFSCPECEKCFSSKSNLIKHQKTHTGEKPFPCPECEKCFTDKSSYNKHQKVHTGDKPFICPECEKCFIRKALLKTHLRTHTGEKPYSCPECEKCFSIKSSLELHQRIHTGENQFSCTECEKCFSKKSNLIQHQRTHTGENPFSCSECGKLFSVKSSFVRHLKIHTGENPFSCSECGKLFCVKSSFVRHLKIHTGEKPFSCTECGKCFSEKSSLEVHQRIHTG
ncbi:oocyte zinc finger protein XlCOF6-like, partial [Bufo gargarizans]|uniref:oocyte zinc finger protein XlCOF6-like n=1 Tax=Bufo gargarizans TaxID=30331 RepID=UPI001CF1832F